MNISAGVEHATQFDLLLVDAVSNIMVKIAKEDNLDFKSPDDVAILSNALHGYYFEFIRPNIKDNTMLYHSSILACATIINVPEGIDADKVKDLVLKRYNYKNN